MPPSLGSRQNFQMWKWRALHKRRLFFIILLQLILIFVWLTIFWKFQGGFYLFSARYEKGSYGADYSSLPGVFFVLHCVLCAAIVFSPYVRQMLNETQGKKICIASVLSLLLAIFFLLGPFNILQEDNDTDTNSATFAMLTVFGLSVCQYVGLNETVTLGTRIFVFSMWIIFFVDRDCNALAIVTLSLNAMAVFASSSLQEHEFLRAFAKQKDFSSNAFGSGNLVADIVFAAKALEQTTLHHYALLSADGNCKTMHAVAVVNPEEEAKSLDERFVETGPSVAWEWTYQAASLEETRRLCRSIFFATASKVERTTPRATFLFSKVCHEIFGLFESVCGSALTLYVNDSEPVFVTTYKEPFELMMFLLIYDLVRVNNRGLCLVSCESVADEWVIRLQVTATDVDRGKGGSVDDTRSREVDETNAHAVGELELQQLHTRHLMMRLAESGAVGRDLQLDEEADSQISCMDRLADRISNSYLQALVDVDDAQFASGLSITRKVLKMPPGSCTPAAAMTRNRSLEVESVCEVQQDWVFLVDRHQDDDDCFAEIKSKFVTMSLPHCAMTIAELRASIRRHSVVLVYDCHIPQLGKEVLRDVGRLCLSVMVVFESPRMGSLPDLKVMYGLTALSGMYVKSTMLEVFGHVKLLTYKHSPRRFLLDGPPPEEPVPLKVRNHSGMFVESTTQGKSVLVRPGDSSRSQQTTHHIISKDHERSHDESVARWLVLVRRFQMLMDFKFPDDKEYITSTLGGRVLEIENLKQEDRNVLAKSSLHMKDCLKDLNPQKMKARQLVTTYLPFLATLRQLLSVEDFDGMVVEAGKFSVESSNMGLTRLQCWFTTLQEVLTMTIRLYGRGRDVGDEMKLEDVLESHTEIHDLVVASRPAALDRRVTAVLMEMISAVEVSLWDLAMDK